uniref:Uncharacterized protein n=1 Tax=Acrobeloides nanus TaxID=290746 RepID=A0A914E330_9BILA
MIVPKLSMQELNNFEEAEFLDKYLSSNESSVFIGILVGINLLIITVVFSYCIYLLWIWRRHNFNISSGLSKIPIILTFRRNNVILTPATNYDDLCDLL